MEWGPLTRCHAPARIADGIAPNPSAVRTIPGGDTFLVRGRLAPSSGLAERFGSSTAYDAVAPTSAGLLPPVDKSRGTPGTRCTPRTRRTGFGAPPSASRTWGTPTVPLPEGHPTLPRLRRSTRRHRLTPRPTRGDEWSRTVLEDLSLPTIPMSESHRTRRPHHDESCGTLGSRCTPKTRRTCSAAPPSVSRTTGTPRAPRLGEQPP